jgi:hypothetical protein
MQKHISPSTKIKTPSSMSYTSLQKVHPKRSMGYKKMREIKDAVPKKHEPKIEEERNKRCHAKEA